MTEQTGGASTSVWVLKLCDETIDCDDHWDVYGVYSSPDAAREALPDAGWYENTPGSGFWLCQHGLGILVRYELDSFAKAEVSDAS